MRRIVSCASFRDNKDFLFLGPSNHARHALRRSASYARLAQESTVDVPGRAVDKARLLGEQEGDDVRDLLWAAGAGHGREGGRGRGGEQGAGTRVVRQRRVDESGGDVVPVCQCDWERSEQARTRSRLGYS